MTATVSDPAARLLLQRLLLLLVRVRNCDQVCVQSVDFCDQHERDWERLERDVRNALDNNPAN